MIVGILPAFAGIVQGVVVHMAKYKFGKSSSNKPLDSEGALTILKIAYMLFDVCPSGYCKIIEIMTSYFLTLYRRKMK